MLRRFVLILLLALIPALLFAQAISGDDQLREGLLQFKQGEYQEAIRAFRGLSAAKPTALSLLRALHATTASSVP